MLDLSGPSFSEESLGRRRTPPGAPFRFQRSLAIALPCPRSLSFSRFKLSVKSFLELFDHFRRHFILLGSRVKSRGLGARFLNGEQFHLVEQGCVRADDLRPPAARPFTAATSRSMLAISEVGG